jgi:hypothetical protein
MESDNYSEFDTRVNLHRRNLGFHAGVIVYILSPGLKGKNIEVGKSLKTASSLISYSLVSMPE